MSRFRHDYTTINKVRDYAANGLSASQIGLTLGVSKNVVIGIVHRNDIQLNPPGSGERRLRWSDADWATVRKALKAGQTSRSAGQLVGRSRDAICAKCLAMGEPASVLQGRKR